MDAAAALRLPGVVGFYSAKDVPGDNMIGPIMHDEEVFATDTVTCVGQVRLQGFRRGLKLGLGFWMCLATT